MHSEISLGDRHDDRTRGPVANLLLQSHALTLEIRLALDQLSQCDTFLVPIAPPRNDCRSDEDERDEAAGNNPAARLQPSFRHARRCALRARGFRSISGAPAVIGLRVIIDPSARPRHVHVGGRGGQMHSRDHSSIVRLVIRSAPE